MTAFCTDRRRTGCPIQAAPALAARNIPSALTSTLADIATLFLLTHDPHDLGRGEAAEISSDKRAIAPVVLERAQQFIAKISMTRASSAGIGGLDASACFAKAKNFVVASTIAARLSGSQSSRSSCA